MEGVKQVPTEPALDAAYEAFDRTGRRYNEPDEFRDWVEDRELFDITQVDVTAARHYAAQAPKTPMGAAWADALVASADLADADVWRSYDETRLGQEDYETQREIHALADAVVGASVLLAPVAATLNLAVLSSGHTLEDWACQRSEITDERIVVHTWSDSRRSSHDIPWAHVHGIFPGLRERITPLIDHLHGGLPTYEAEQVAGVSRTPAPLRRSLRRGPA